MAAVAGGCVLVGAARARAYPQWQLSGGVTRCNQCHVAPAGGGLLNAQGRRAAGDDLSTFAGDGALLHGAAQLPAWLVFGADLRSGFAARDVQDPNGIRRSLSPMVVDAGVLLSVKGWSLSGTLGTRGDLDGDGAQSGAQTRVPSQNYQPLPAAGVVSRQHWLMWQPSGARGFYARAGRFFAPFGLQLAQAMTYVRRDLGFGPLEESYNLSAGYVDDDWEAHATAFVPDFVRHDGGVDSGSGAYLERRLFSGRAALAIQGKYATRPGSSRTIGGVLAKGFVAPIRTLFFAEADVVRLSVTDIAARDQALGLLGASLLPARGLVITGIAERYQEDLAVQGAARSAATISVGWLPYAHFEAQVLARAELPAGGDVAKLLFAQLHYFL
jgi:hypothetical protein